MPSELSISTTLPAPHRGAINNAARWCCWECCYVAGEHDTREEVWS